MGNHAGGAGNARRESLLTIVSSLVLAVTLLVGFSAPLRSQAVAVRAPAAQLSTPQWQVDAGGKMAFDVASVKQDTTAQSPTTVSSNIALGPGDYYTPTGGLFSVTNIPLNVYIAFAYKLTGNQTRSLLTELPKWATTDRFDIQARAAAGDPTKDQMRLMMQSLLMDRFKLAVHFETRQLPVFELVLDKPEKNGPQLQPHPADSACSTVPPAPSAAGSPAPPAIVAGGFPITCGGIQPMQASVPGRVRAGARNVTMELIASTLTAFGDLDRPVLNHTGLSGTFDLLLEWTPQFNGPLPPGVNFQPDESGPTFQQALKEQLGLKLESQNGPVAVLVIDHIEQPSAN
jgi:uncharacterized protein (TIGR03435 family)